MNPITFAALLSAQFGITHNLPAMSIHSSGFCPAYHAYSVNISADRSEISETVNGKRIVRDMTVSERFNDSELRKKMFLGNVTCNR
jgi:hypothetical protein